MKRVLLIGALFATLMQYLVAQVDNDGNPVFNSKIISEKSFKKFSLNASYYTLKNNIENEQSSVFVSDEPTLDQIAFSARNLPSDFFIVSKDQGMQALILLQELPLRQFLVINLSTNQTKTYKCTLKGDLTENRANELLAESYDTSAKRSKDVINFNGKDYKIMASAKIEKEVLNLIEKEKIYNYTVSKVQMRTQEELRTYILKESMDGGAMDYFTPIKGKENDGIQIKPGVFDTKRGAALYAWGRKCFDLGVNTIDDVYAIFKEVKKAELTGKEREYIKIGFDKEWEK